MKTVIKNRYTQKIIVESTEDLYLTVEKNKAHLTGADLTGANLINADLTGANLYGVRITRSQKEVFLHALKIKII